MAVLTRPIPVYEYLHTLVRDVIQYHLARGRRGACIRSADKLHDAGNCQLPRRSRGARGRRSREFHVRRERGHGARRRPRPIAMCI